MSRAARARDAVLAARLAWAACCIACCTAACAVDGNTDVRAYRDVLDAGAPPAPRELAPDAVLDTRALLLLANANNERLALEGEAYVRALIDRRRAAAVFLPTVELAPGYFARGGDGIATSDGIDVPLSAELDLALRSDPANVRRADAAAAQGLAALYAAQDGLWIDVARAEFEVLRAERSNDVLANSLRVQEARVGDARARRDVGFARPLDVSLIEAEAADTRVERIEAQRTATVGRALLASLTGVSIDARELDGELAVPDVLPPRDECVDQALARRAELVAAEHAIRAARETVRVASGRWWPSISVDLDAFLARDSEPSEQDWSALVAVHLPLFSAGRIRADVRTALSLLRAAELELARARRDVRRDCTVAYENLAAAREREAQLDVRVASAREAFELAERLYDAGLGTNLERLIAQEQQVTAELALESARLDVRLFYLDLLRARGLLHAWLGLARSLPPLAAEHASHAEAR